MGWFEDKDTGGVWLEILGAGAVVAFAVFMACGGC